MNNESIDNYSNVMFNNMRFLTYNKLYKFIYCFRHLGSNPFVCNCQLSWLANYLSNNPIETSGAKCMEPKKFSRKPIGRLRGDNFKCKNKATFIFVNFNRNSAKNGELQPIRNEHSRFWLVASHRTW